MEKLVINNLTADDLDNLYGVLLHIADCYVNLSHPCKDAECCKVDGVYISPSEFESLSKIITNIGNYLQFSNGK